MDAHGGRNGLVLAMSLWICMALAAVVGASAAERNTVTEDEQVFVFSAVNFTGEKSEMSRESWHT